MFVASDRLVPRLVPGLKYQPVQVSIMGPGANLSSNEVSRPAEVAMER